mmetsp:Transcript_28822/g.59012  ORF Transcript_28822/g.59012 Transcript_28822/m.59012 type:complete len:521 (-) Transcript_28822:138-1700(-)
MSTAATAKATSESISRRAPLAALTRPLSGLGATRPTTTRRGIHLLRRIPRTTAGVVRRRGAATEATRPSWSFRPLSGAASQEPGRIRPRTSSPSAPSASSASLAPALFGAAIGASASLQAGSFDQRRSFFGLDLSLLDGTMEGHGSRGRGAKAAAQAGDRRESSPARSDEEVAKVEALALAQAKDGEEAEEDEGSNEEGVGSDEDTDEEDELARLAARLDLSGLGDLGKEEDKDEGGRDPTLQTVASWIGNGTVQKVLVLSGAGVSCSAGIPDFRTPGTGLYDNLQKYNLPFPEAIFDLGFYRQNSDPFVNLASEIWPGLKFSPTLTHSFVALLEKKGLLLRNYTQNIDGLEVLAGLSEERIVECHGHFRTASCINCFYVHDGDDCKAAMVEEKRAPRCRRCHGPVKPDIVFFGEGLPDRFGRLLRRDMRSADLILVMGTSLMVAPVSMIPEMVERDCRRVLINRELVGNFVPGGGPGKHPDVFVGGDCDESVTELCRHLGWEEELTKLNKKSKIRDSGG